MEKLIDLVTDALKWLFGFFRRPVLAIRFEQNSEPFIGHDALNDNRVAAFYRLTVQNQGKTPAEDCQAYLVSVAPVVGNRSRAGTLGKPEILKWAHEQEFHTIRIEAGEPRKFDLFYVYEDDPGHLYFFFQQPDRPVGVSPNFPAGEYELRVRVNHKGHNPAHAAFAITIAGGYSNAIVRQLN